MRKMFLTAVLVLGASPALAQYFEPCHLVGTPIPDHPLVYCNPQPIEPPYAPQVYYAPSGYRMAVPVVPAAPIAVPVAVPVPMAPADEPSNENACYGSDGRGGYKFIGRGNPECAGGKG